MASFVTLAGGLVSPTVSADGHESEEDSSQPDVDEDESQDESHNEDVSGNSYTAADCQSLTELVRADISTRNDSLTSEQRVAAETWATQELGAYDLNLGQNVTLSEDVINKSIERAEALSASEQKAWAPYARLVDDFAGTVATSDSDEDDASSSDDQSGSGDDSDLDSSSEDTDSEDATSDADDIDSESTDEDDSEDNGSDDAESEDDDNSEDATSDSTSNLPWIAAAIAAGGGWVYLRRREAQAKK